MDVLADLLGHSHARGAVFAQTAIAADRGVQFRGRRLLAVHTVLNGAAWFERDGADSVQVSAGDLMLVPIGVPYRVVPCPGAVADVHQLGETGYAISPPDPSAAARMLCGAYTIRAPLSELLLSALPPLVRIRGDGQDRRLALTLALMAVELADPRPGWQALLDRTLDVLLALSLRAWFAMPEAEVPGWYAALEDPIVGPAVSAIHADPARAWAVHELARLADVSRAAFAQRFTSVVGRTPIAYLTDWRMTIAAQALLDDPAATIAQVAQLVGYSSEYAFATAFRRHHGSAPGRWRKGVAQS